jgi:T-complex protein 1 subunit beta
MAVSDTVKTTLGPKGMDKIIVSAGSGKVTVTNDGATILKKLVIDNPAAKILVDISKSQDDEVGDGTTTVCVLAGSLLAEAEGLLNQKIHPQTIVAGWRLAYGVAKSVLESLAVDRSSQPDSFRLELVKLAKTSLSSKILDQESSIFPELCVDAVLRLKGSGNLESIQVIKVLGGGLRDCYLEEGSRATLPRELTRAGSF